MLKHLLTIHDHSTDYPNTGHMDIWLQRIGFPFAPDMEYSEFLCSLVTGCDTQIWNNEWISSVALNKALDAKQIIDQKALQELDAIVPTKEAELFLSKDWVS